MQEMEQAVCANCGKLFFLAYLPVDESEVLCDHCIIRERNALR